MITTRSYLAEELKVVKQLFIDVFTDSEGREEGLLIGDFVEAMATTTAAEDMAAYVAFDNEVLVGAIFFSRLSFEQELNAFILSPVAVHSAYQGKGIGQQLIRFGLDQMKQRGVILALTYGDPNYYSKVGFQPITERVIKAPQPLSQPEGWLGQSLTGGQVSAIAGPSSCVEALDKPELW